MEPLTAFSKVSFYNFALNKTEQNKKNTNHQGQEAWDMFAGLGFQVS